MWISTTATMKFDPHPCMPRRNQPSGSSMIQQLQRTPRMRTAEGMIHQCQQNARHHLQKQQHQTCAAKDVPPARGTSAAPGCSSGVLDGPRVVHAALPNRRRACTTALWSGHASILETSCGNLVLRSKGKGFCSRDSAASASAPHRSAVSRPAPLVIGKQSPLRRPRRAVPVRVVDAAMTRTHKQLRLRKPAHRAAKMCAVDRKHGERVAAACAHIAGTFAVSPSHASVYGFEMWPASSRLREIRLHPQWRSTSCSSLLAAPAPADSRPPASQSAAATSAFIAMPTFIRNVRRVTRVCFPSRALFLLTALAEASRIHHRSCHACFGSMLHSACRSPA